MTLGLMKSAIFSPCRKYRYVLTRAWDEAKKPVAIFIGLNPSTADENIDDPTIRRCMGFARDWGCGGLVMLNLFALRSTDPRGLRKCADPIGPESDQFLRDYCTGNEVICAWGVHSSYLLRGVKVRQMLKRIPETPLKCLGRTTGGHPKHPLYLPKDAARVEF